MTFMRPDGSLVAEQTRNGETFSQLIGIASVPPAHWFVRFVFFSPFCLEKVQKCC